MGIVILLAAAAFGQDKEPKARVVLYKDRLAAQFDTVDCVKNIFKINPLLLLRGELPLYYERALTPRLSLELAAGITTRNYLSFSFSGDDVDDFGEATKIRTRPAFHLGARYYTTDDLEPQGWYWQIDLTYLEYAKDIRTKDSTGQFTDIRLPDRRIYNDLRLQTGYQMLSGTSNWLFDLYGGFGLRDRSISKVVEDHNLETGVRTYGIEEVDDIIPVVFLGIKIGMGF